MENTDERLVDFFLKDKPLADAFKCLFENASDAIYILDKNGNFVAVNRKAEELTGFRREDFVGKSFRTIIPGKSLPKAIREFLDVVRGKEIKIELELKTAFKKKVLVEVSSKPLIVKGKIVGTLGIVRDITERVQIENKLKETNRKLEMLFDTAMEGITVVDAKENLIFVNNAFTDMLGYEEDELIGMNLQKFVDGQGFKEIRRQTESRKKGKVSRYELVMFGKDGKPRIVQVSASPLWNEDGHFAGSLAILMDVTKRKRAEEALRESGERYKELTESISDVFFAMDKNLRYTYWNKASENLTGISAKNAIGKSLIDIFPDVKGTKVGKLYLKTLKTQQPQSFVNAYLVGGKDYVFEINAYPTKTGLSVFVKDITERKKMESALKKSGKI